MYFLNAGDNLADSLGQLSDLNDALLVKGVNLTLQFGNQIDLHRIQSDSR